MPSFADMVQENIARVRGRVQDITGNVRANVQGLRPMGGILSNPTGILNRFPMVQDRINMVRSRVRGAGQSPLPSLGGSASRTTGGLPTAGRVKSL